MKLKQIVYSILNENTTDFENIQSIINGNQFVKGTADKESIIETDKHILFISPESLKHIKERHSDRSKPGSIITGDLKDIITKTIQKSPSESSGGRVKWLDVKVGNVGEMGVAKATPEEVSGMTDYTMPDGRKETVKIKQGQRPKTDVFNVITAEIGKDSGKPVLSIITAFPGPNSIDGAAMPMDRNEFAEKGFYFIVNKKLDENMKPSKEILRMKKLAGLITENVNQTAFPEFVGEPEREINNLANQFVTTIEDELKANQTTGTLEFMDYYTSDESDPTWIDSNKWYYDIARYMKPKGDEVMITAGTKSGTPALKLTFDESTQNINWKTI